MGDSKDSGKEFWTKARQNATVFFFVFFVFFEDQYFF